MQNKLKYSYGGLVTQYSQAISGVETHAAALGLVIVSAVSMNTTRTALIASENSGKLAKEELVKRQAALLALNNAIRKQLFVVRDSLKLHLGKQYSSAWEATGFVNTLTVPRKHDSIVKLLLALGAYFTAHPEHENEAFDVTAANATESYNDLVAGVNGVNAQTTTWQLALATRDAKAELARADIRALIKELTIRLDSMDERWTAFGFNKPGQLQTPPTPEKVSAMPSAPGEVRVRWEKAARAKTYRIWKRVAGETDTYVLLGTTSELMFLIEGLDSGVTLEIYVSASNNGGESQKSEKTEVTTT